MMEKHVRAFWGNENVLNFVTTVVYMSVIFCQNALNCILKMFNYIECKLQKLLQVKNAVEAQSRVWLNYKVSKPPYIIDTIRKVTCI